MGAEANGEGTQTVEATAGSEAADTTQAVGADEAAGAQHSQVLGGNAGEDAGSAVDYETAIAERDAKIADLESQIKSASQSAETAEALRTEINELKEQSASERMDFQLQLAGCRNTKAARAVLDDYDGDVDAMKAAEPWLFQATSPTTTAATGTTGLPNAGTANDEDATLKRWREIAGLTEDDGR